MKLFGITMAKSELVRIMRRSWKFPQAEVAPCCLEGTQPGKNHQDCRRSGEERCL